MAALSEQEFRVKSDQALESARRSLLPLADTDGFEIELHRGVLNVVFEDHRNPNLLFVGNDTGVFVSMSGGDSWVKMNNNMPNVPVHDLLVHPRDNDLVLATHGRGIWIVDDITPWRYLTPELTTQEAAFVSARPTQQRIEALGGWPSGAAAFKGDDPAAGAVITYYQKTRHLFGKLKIEILDSKGTVVDELPASTRRGYQAVSARW